MLKVAIYIRVSTEDQAKDDYSLEVQREYLKPFTGCEKNKFLSKKIKTKISRV